MWRKVKLLFSVCVVTLSLGMTVGTAFGQVNNQDETGQTTTTVRDDNDGFDFSWIGLIGLVGLAGLMPKDQRNRNDQDIKR